MVTVLCNILEINRLGQRTGLLRAILVTGLIVLLGALNAPTADWPQFRGPHRDGVWAETNLLETFPQKGLKISWRHPVGGGFSSPVVAQGRVFVLDVELTAPSARERLHCFQEKTGKVLWVYAYAEHYSEWTFVPERGAGPTATPIVEGQRIYAVGASGFVHCLDVKTGHVIWEKHLGREYEIAEMSCRPSPLIEGAFLIVSIGAKPGASVLALDKETGKELWKALDDQVSNSSPIVITFAGRRQLIVWSNNALSSLDPSNGHIYWRELMNTSGNDSAATPVLQRNRLLVSGLMLELSGDTPGARFLWPENRAPSKRLLSNTSTAVLEGDYIYSAKSWGELVCLDAATGNERWSTNSVTSRKNGASIHITPQGSGYYLFTDEGNLIRAELSPSGYREKSRSHLIAPTWPFAGTKYVYAPPAYANGHVIVRNEGEVVCASLERR
jgi:outer membrane protein assembly factor BamB